MIGTWQGKTVKFHEDEIRPMGRQAAGVKGIKLSSKDKIIGMVVIGENDKHIFTASQKGFGKKTDVDSYPCHHRGGQGVINLKVNSKIGNAVGIVGVNEHEMLLITEKGKIIRIKTENVRSIGRATQGVKIINLGDDDTVCSIAKVRES
jgi:DNA gyrase subunit A